VDSREITVFKTLEDESSPDFPMVLPLSTISELVRDLETFVGVQGVSGIVTFHDSSLKILTNIRQLPLEATVSLIKKKGRDYFKLD
jgi:hypothetical protein